jgi:hypothetical protein
MHRRVPRTTTGGEKPKSIAGAYTKLPLPCGADPSDGSPDLRQSGIIRTGIICDMDHRTFPAGVREGAFPPRVELVTCPRLRVVIGTAYMMMRTRTGKIEYLRS